MAFKIKPPFQVDNTPIYNYPMEEEGVLGKANKNGTIIIDPNLSPAQAKEVEEHEMGHIDQMKRGDLDYDDENVYWKGKTYPRSKMNEGAHDLPWEKEIYNKTEKSENMGFKLSGKKEKTSPFAIMVDKGLISPLNANGDDKKKKNIRKDENLVKDEEQSSRYKQGEWDIPQATLDAMQKKLDEKAKSTGEYQETTLSARRGGLDGYDKAWKENKDGVQGKYKSYEDFASAADKWWKGKEKKLVASPPPETLKTPPTPEQKVSQKTAAVKTIEHQADKGDRTHKAFEEVPIYTNRYNRETGKKEKVITGYRQQQIKGVGGKKILTDYQSTDHGTQITEADGKYVVGPGQVSHLTNKDITRGKDELDINVSKSNIPGLNWNEGR